MEALNRQLHRLFGPQASSGQAIGADQTLCLSVSGRNAWALTSTVIDTLRGDLGLPELPVSVDGDGFRIWFALHGLPSWPTAQRQGLITALGRHCFPELPGAPLRLTEDGCWPVEMLGDERWSAFIDPTLGSLFDDTPWLDMPPNPDQQAERLARLTPLTERDLNLARQRLGITPQTAIPATTPVTLNIAAHSDPLGFLLSVMNDPQAPLAQRIEAASRLLPYRDQLIAQSAQSTDL